MEPNIPNIQIRSCFLCDKIVMMDSIHCSGEDYDSLRKTLGEIPERFGSSIGNKIICKSCKESLKAILED